MLTRSQRTVVPVWWLVAGILIVHASMLAWMAYRYSPTIDEPAHLVAGISHWRYGRFDLYRVNPPLVRLVAALPMLIIDPKVDWSSFTEAPYARPEFTIGNSFANSDGLEVFWYFTICRWCCIPFSVVGGWCCYRWARELYGVRSGLVALVLWCFCPNVLGNGALVTPDTPAAALGTLAGYTFWRWLRTPSWPRALLAGLALGLAQLTKSTWIILFPLWPAVWLVAEIARGRARYSSRAVGTAATPRGKNQNHETVCNATQRFTQLATGLGIALYVLNLGYGFEQSFQSLGKFQFISHTLGGPGAHEKPGNRFAGYWLGAIPAPVPTNYLSGIDVQRYDFEKGKWSYLRGEQKFGGWSYYYVYAMLVKMPAGSLFLLGLTTVNSARRAISSVLSRGGNPVPHPASSILRLPVIDSLALLAPALLLITLVSSQTGFSRYLRYVLPAFPFLYIWASQLATESFLAISIGSAFHPALVGAERHRARGLRSLSKLFLLGFLPVRRSALSSVPAAAVLSSLTVFPHSLSYFNEVAGGPLNGPAHLLDGNLDWGQDLVGLKDWQNRQHARPMHVNYFGRVEPHIAGISPKSQSIATAPAHVVEWYAISVNHLHGYKHDGAEVDSYEWLRHAQPPVRVGYSILVFHRPIDSDPVEPHGPDADKLPSRSELGQFAR